LRKPLHITSTLWISWYDGCVAADFVSGTKKLAMIPTVSLHIVVIFTTILMLILAWPGKFCYNWRVNVGLISFDVGTFTSYVRRSEANVRFHKLPQNGNFLARVKA